MKLTWQVFRFMFPVQDTWKDAEGILENLQFKRAKASSTLKHSFICYSKCEIRDL